MAVCDWADVYEHKVGIGAGHRAALKARCLGLGSLVHLEEDLLLGDLGEVEALGVKRLADLQECKAWVTCIEEPISGRLEWLVCRDLSWIPSGLHRFEIKPKQIIAVS